MGFGDPTAFVDSMACGASMSCACGDAMSYGTKCLPYAVATAAIHAMLLNEPSGTIIAPPPEGGQPTSAEAGRTLWMRLAGAASMRDLGYEPPARVFAPAGDGKDKCVGVWVVRGAALTLSSMSVGVGGASA